MSSNSRPVVLNNHLHAAGFGIYDFIAGRSNILRFFPCADYPKNHWLVNMTQSDPRTFYAPAKPTLSTPTRPAR